MIYHKNPFTFFYQNLLGKHLRNILRPILAAIKSNGWPKSCCSMPRLESPSLCHWRSRRKKKTNIFLKETWIIGHVSEAIKVWCRNQLFKLIWAESSVELFWSIFQLMLSKPFARWTYTIQSAEFYQRGPKKWLNDRTVTFSDILVIFQSTFSCWMAEVHNVIDCIRENTLCKASKCRGIYNLTRRKMVNISFNFL